MMHSDSSLAMATGNNDAQKNLSVTIPFAVLNQTSGTLLRAMCTACTVDTPLCAAGGHMRIDEGIVMIG